MFKNVEEEKKPPAEGQNLPAKKEETAISVSQEDDDEVSLVLDGDHKGFSDEEALGGMPPVIQGYMKSYGFFMRSNNGMFELRDNEKDEVVWSGESIPKAVIYYAHHTKTLTRGAMEGMKTDMDQWTEEQKELLALTYDESSKGNFAMAGLDHYLTKPLWDAVTTRVFVFMICPDLPSKGNVIACSFGITSDMLKKAKSLANFRLQVSKIRLPGGYDGNIPMSYMYSELFHTPDVNEGGKGYRRVCFKLKTHERKLLPAFNSPDEYRKSPYGAALHAKIKKSHEMAVAYAESGNMPMISSVSKNTIETPLNGSSEGTVFNDVPPSEPFNDDIPF